MESTVGAVKYQLLAQRSFSCHFQIGNIEKMFQAFSSSNLVFQWQALFLSPVCPHVCDHLWSLLGKEGTILNAKWPKAGQVDLTAIQQSEYLMEAVR